MSPPRQRQHGIQAEAASGRSAHTYTWPPQRVASIIPGHGWTAQHRQVNAPVRPLDTSGSCDPKFCGFPPSGGASHCMARSRHGSDTYLPTAASLGASAATTYEPRSRSMPVMHPDWCEPTSAEDAFSRIRQADAALRQLAQQAAADALRAAHRLHALAEWTPPAKQAPEALLGGAPAPGDAVPGRVLGADIAAAAAAPDVAAVPSAVAMPDAGRVAACWPAGSVGRGGCPRGRSRGGRAGSGRVGGGRVGGSFSLGTGARPGRHGTREPQPKAPRPARLWPPAEGCPEAEMRAGIGEVLTSPCLQLHPALGTSWR